MPTATCKKCGAEKDVGCFETSKPGGNPRRECKECRKQSRKRVIDAAISSGARKSPDDATKPKACAECGKGPPEVDFMLRADMLTPSWRPICNVCTNGKGYSEAYRARERANDELAYLARNARSHLDWAHRNPDNVRAQQVKQATDPARKIKEIQKTAVYRGLEFQGDESSVMEAALSACCYYCGFAHKPGDVLNGLDRVDSTAGYTAANTVPCCATCNKMKSTIDADVFVGLIRRVASVNPASSEAAGEDVRTRLPPFSYRAELRDRDKKTKTDYLKIDEKIDLWSAPCYLCGRGPSLGIDREDSSGEYTVANSRPCCTACNYMKCDLALADFLAHVGYIVDHTRFWAIGDVDARPLTVFGGKTRTPVAALSENGHHLIVFPSISTAARLIGAYKLAIQKAISSNDRSCRQHRWITVDDIEYTRQCLDATAAKAALSALRVASV